MTATRAKRTKVALKMRRPAATILATLVAIFLGMGLVVALPPNTQPDGTAWAWGNNSFGQLGTGSTTSYVKGTPSRLTGGIAVAAARDHSVALRADGTVWAWGSNAYGQIGNGSTTPAEYIPTRSGMFGATAISASWLHTIALRFDSTVWGWGWGAYGQVGNGSFADSRSPVQVSGLAGVTAISAGGYHSMAALLDGTVWTWGYGGKGQLGNGIIEKRQYPDQVNGLNNVVMVAGGLNHSLALDDDGTVWSWGWNDNGQLGDGTTQTTTTPAPVAGINNIVAISAGGFHSMALASDGSVWIWGYLGAWADYGTRPVRVGISGVKKIASGFGHAVLLKSDGSIWAWGWGEYGQIGAGNGSSYGEPQRVVYVSDTNPAGAAISAGYIHSLAVLCGGDAVGYGGCMSQVLPETIQMNGCTAIGVPESGDARCGYYANGPGTYRARTDNQWEIYVFRGDPFWNPPKVVLASGTGSANGSIASLPNERVYVAIKFRCVGSTCSASGILTASG